jgi:hypothetical protein
VLLLELLDEVIHQTLIEILTTQMLRSRSHHNGAQNSRRTSSQPEE